MDDRWESEISEFGAINITGFRIIDDNRRYVQEFLDGWKSLDQVSAFHFVSKWNLALRNRIKLAKFKSNTFIFDFQTANIDWCWQGIDFGKFTSWSITFRSRFITFFSSLYCCCFCLYFEYYLIFKSFILFFSVSFPSFLCHSFFMEYQKRLKPL